MLQKIYKNFKWNIYFTIFLIIGESVVWVFIPLAVGIAIDDLMIDNFDGLINLGFLSTAVLLFFAGRRFFDSRFYSKVYEYISLEVIARDNNISNSKKVARLSMLAEVVDFAEDDIPELVFNIIGIIGIAYLISTLNMQVFYLCLILIAIAAIVYISTGTRTIKYNREYNNELEKQLKAIKKEKPQKLKRHIRKLMKWNIKLSDLETINFSIVWISITAFLLYSIVLSVKADNVSYGLVFSLIIYLIEFIEHIVFLPEYYQKFLRLEEIIGRVKPSSQEDL